MTTLLDITAEIEQLQSALLSAETEEEQAALMAEYFQSEQDLKKKVESYVNLISELEARAEFRKQESRRLAELAATDSNLAKRLKNRLLWYLQAQGLTKLQTPRYNLSLTRASGKVPLIINEDFPVVELPEEFQKVSIDFDKEAIRQALEEGKELEFAALGDRQITLRIK